MVFSSIYFVLYFLPVLLVSYYLAPDKWKNAVLLISSCYYYMWGEPSFFFLVFISLILDFYLVQLMHYAEGKRRKILVYLLVGLNVANLVIYKYLMFVVFNINVILESAGVAPIHLLIFLPIGISFITFQKVSYVIDVYRGISSPQSNFVNYGLYILYFPQLIAGPIIRYHEIAEQIKDRRAHETLDNKLLGLFRFVIGLSKKVLIADQVGIFVDEVFAVAPADLSTPLAWLGVIAYSIQLYFDFSGYSDMAIGIARMMGFRFPENFNFPYISQSITEFWRRWHMTLSYWMRDYLYIPLGGNRASPRRMYLNLWIVFLLSGLWHGASWNFVVFGAFHGLFLVLEKGLFARLMKNWWKGFRILYAYIILLISFVIFRHTSFVDSLLFIRQLFVFQFSPDYVAADDHVLFLLVIGLIMAFMGAFKRGGTSG